MNTDELTQLAELVRLAEIVIFVLPDQQRAAIGKDLQEVLATAMDEYIAARKPKILMS